jgi:hypothetical protein
MFCSITFPPLQRQQDKARVSDFDADSTLDFATDIGYALWRENLSRGKQKLDLDDCRAIGRRVLEHLRLSNVELSRKPAGTPPARYPQSRSD